MGVPLYNLLLLLAFIVMAVAIVVMGTRLRRVTGALAESKRREGALSSQVEALQRLRERLQEAQELAGLRTWDWEMTGSPETWAARTFRLFSFIQGAEAEDEQLSVRTVHPEDREDVQAAIVHAIEHTGVLRVSFRTVGGAGEVKHLEARARIRRAAEGPARILGTVLDVTELKHAEAALRRTAATDGLTGAYTRGHFFELAEREFERWRRYGHDVAVMMLDVDEFKPLNDAFGHAFGDEVLRALVRTARQALRRSDILGRYGGDEFVVMLPNSSIEEAAETATRLGAAVAALVLPVSGGAGEAHLTVSIGVTGISAVDADVEAALKRADKALYDAKAAGRNRVARR
ncbi:MAG: diguanylate cyclase [Gammaproteobacteria bacterium]|nr:diguanylate cyclase [Gammaproteobacteria bacterium]